MTHKLTSCLALSGTSGSIPACLCVTLLPLGMLDAFIVERLPKRQFVEVLVGLAICKRAGKSGSHQTAVEQMFQQARPLKLPASNLHAAASLQRGVVCMMTETWSHLVV